MLPTDVGSLGIDHVSYALFDFSLSFLIYLVITFLVHIYQTTGRNGAALAADSARPQAEEAGYAKIQRHSADPDAPEAYEMAEQDSFSGDEDAVKIGTEDEVDWIDKHLPNGSGVRL